MWAVTLLKKPWSSPNLMGPSCSLQMMYVLYFPLMSDSMWLSGVSSIVESTGLPRSFGQVYPWRSKYTVPHRAIWIISGRALLSKSIRTYSVLGGTIEYTVRATSLSASSSISYFVIIFPGLRNQGMDLAEPLGSVSQNPQDHRPVLPTQQVDGCSHGIGHLGLGRVAVHTSIHFWIIYVTSCRTIYKCSLCMTLCVI